MSPFVLDVATCPRQRSLTRFYTAALTILFFVGCVSQESTPKASHFEHDHNVASHWPNDLADAAVKIRERLVWIETGEVPEHHPHDDHGHNHDHDHTSEILDLVSWVPEVAGDTNLSEVDWLPLYHASESLMRNLRAAKDTLSSDDRTQIESLCQLIDKAVPEIHEHLANLKVTSP
jgi:hypothetical protein